MADDEKKKSSEQPIIVKKIKKGGHGHHGGAWKVAYADFVTAMMAFFIVMWILAAGQDVQQQVSAYFNDPGLFKFIEGRSAIPIDLGLKPIPGKRAGDEKGEGKGQTPEEFMGTISTAQKDSLIKELMQQAKQDSIKAAENLKQTAEVIKELMKQVGVDNPEMKELLNSVQFEYTQEGLRIQMIESKESLFFKLGSSELLPKAKKLLLTLAKEIGKLPNLVEIEGHTDARSYGNKAGYTNWELSSDRANSTRRSLVNSGLWNGQVTQVTGYADKKLRNPGNPFDEHNRRVTILVKHLSTSDIIEDKVSPKEEEHSEKETEKE